MRVGRRAAGGSALALAFAVAFAACVGSDPDAVTGASDASLDRASVVEGGASDGGASDGSPGDPSGGPCTSDMPFKEYVPMGAPINTGVSPEYLVRLDPSEQHLYLGRALEVQRYDRDAAANAWVAGPVVLSPTAQQQFGAPWIGASGSPLWYTRKVGDATPYELAVADVDAGTGALANPRPVRGITGAAPISNVDGYLSPDQSELWFATANGDLAATPFNIVHAVADGTDAGFGDVKVPAGDTINTAVNERFPVISADGLTLYFASETERKLANYGIRMATRPSKTEGFGPSRVPAGLEPLQDFSRGFQAMPAWISPDNCRLYVGTTINGQSDIYIARRR